MGGIGLNWGCETDETAYVVEKNAKGFWNTSSWTKVAELHCKTHNHAGLISFSLIALTSEKIQSMQAKIL